MVNIAKRMRAFQPLYNIRHGQGAAILPPRPAPQLTKFNVHIPKSPLSPELFKDTRGAHALVKELLPRIKYHNPTLPITVQKAETQPRLELTFESDQQASLRAIEAQARRSEAYDVRATWSDIVTEASSTQDAATQSSASVYRRTFLADISGHEVSKIWTLIAGVTGAKDAPPPTAEEAEQMRKLNEFFEQSEIDRRLVKAGRDAVKKEKEELRKAREAAERLSAEAQ